MRWRGRRQSSNIEDRRGAGAGGLPGGTGLFRLLPLLFRFLGFKGGIFALLAMGALFYFTGGDLSGLLGEGVVTGGSQRSSTSVKQSATEKEQVAFVSVVLADTEDTWHKLFAAVGRRYEDPHLVLFRGSTRSGCGNGQASMGPFYCPADRKLYIDLSFYQDLKERFRAPGDFAQAYVIAHEVGHHVQTLLGISGKVQDAKKGLGQVATNRLSVRQELQADCFAGIWGHYASRSRDLLEQGDVEEGLTAAAAIGDDRLQKQAGGRVTPDSFTHGSSAQRVRWFKTGLEKGTLEACNTFAGSVGDP